MTVGLTGGIGTGKSTVAELLRARGLPVVDADQLAREVVAPGEPTHAAIVAAFGPEVLAADGTLDRRALGRVVFEDDTLRKRLESLIHPAIAQRAQARLLELGRAGHRLAFYEAALLCETGAYRLFPALVVVSAPAALQRQRVLARDPDLSPADVDARIAAQMSLEAKEKLATWIVRNDGTREALEAAVDDVIEALRARLDGMEGGGR